MLVLGIETSCDETGLALIDENGVRGRKLSTQVDLHALFGGVVPELASREHAKILPILFDSLLEEANIKVNDIEGIAVANGPGLLGALLVGVGFAKSLALALNIPIVAVNHLHAHLALVGLNANNLNDNFPQDTKLSFPALGLLVSGGHTHLYEINDFNSYRVLGRTLDDAAGEACDKFAKMLGLPYPGGALVDMLGKQGTVQKNLFPRPYTKNDNVDFSFSGLKTAASLFLSNNPEACLEKSTSKSVLTRAEHQARIEKAPQILSDAAASYLYAIADTLAIKTARAFDLCESPPTCLILAGGVAANSFIRERFSLLAKKYQIPLLSPSLALCTDNGEMIAYIGRELLLKGISHSLDFPAFPRGSVLSN